MRSDEKEIRLTELLALKECQALSVSEASELEQLIRQRVDRDAEALSAVARNIEHENDETQRQVQAIALQNRALEQLIREQEDYLKDVSEVIAQMENRRRSWRARYKRVTGRSLKDPIVPAVAR